MYGNTHEGSGCKRILMKQPNLKLAKKPCSCCGGFNRYISTGQCPVCKKQRDKKYRVANLDKYAQYSQSWRKNNPDKATQLYNSWRNNNLDKSRQIYKRHYESNSNKIIQRNKQWHKLNPDKAAMNAERRYINLKEAMPKWVNQKDIKIIYIKRNYLNTIWGTHFEVDHIIPITSKTVCGLHTEANLQLLDASLNGSKLNTYQQDW